MESKHNNKLVNVTRSRLTDIENKLEVTSREGGRAIQGQGVGQTIACKIGTRMYYTTGGYIQYFVITVNGKKLLKQYKNFKKNIAKKREIVVKS